jgi:hypothetical protein
MPSQPYRWKSQNNLIHCYYVALHCRKDGEIRVAAAEAPSDECYRCPLPDALPLYSARGGRHAPTTPLLESDPRRPLVRRSIAKALARSQEQPTASLILGFQ